MSCNYGLRLVWFHAFYGWWCCSAYIALCFHARVACSPRSKKWIKTAKRKEKQ
jgi:hypothetical protein